MQTIPTTKQLENIFPDIKGELCSRHSILFGKLHNTFSKIYDGYDPQRYIIVKGNLHIFNQYSVDLSMALQNGIIVLYKGLAEGDSVYVNSNHFDEELIFTNEGDLEEGIHPCSQDMGLAMKLATQTLQKQRGGILYIHGNIPEDNFSYRESLLLAFYLAIAAINDTLSCPQLLPQLSKLNIPQSYIKALLNCQNRKFNLSVGPDKYKIQLQKNNKLILCHLDVAKLDIKYERKRRGDIAQRRKQILQTCERKAGLNSVLDIFNCEDQTLLSNLQFDELMEFDEQLFQPTKFIETCVGQLSLLGQLNSKNLTFEQYVSAQWEINSKYWQLHSQEVVDLVEEMKEALKINSCMIVNEQFVLIVTDKLKFTDLLIYLRQKLNKGELKSKSLFKIEEELVQCRWSSDKKIGERMFSTVPSQGIAIYDPSDALWFD